MSSHGLERWWALVNNPVRLIAFYLPQYHPIPENDLWWGNGFTEWSNVARARPFFPGHYQPHLPADLGFYDLRLAEVREAQAKLAAEYGIYGFCYHHYWFNGRRLLERPFNEVLASGKPEFPFCICWANGNWTRGWDGSEQAVLIEQRHSHQDDVQFIRSLLPAFRDRRYIKVDGKPLLIVYHSKLLPDPVKTSATWRAEVRAAGFPDLYLIRAETHTSYGKYPNASALGFDAALEFPPHAVACKTLRVADSQYSDSNNTIIDYRKVVRHSIKRSTPDYKLFRGLMPSWDNTARRKKGAHIFAHSSPELYRYWLAECIRWTRRHHTGEEQIVFINAWNEWGEGCHLEPDQRYGYQFLEATRTALRRSENPVAFADLPSACDDQPASKQPTDEVAARASEFLSENLDLNWKRQDECMQINETNISTQSVLVPQIRLDSLLADYLLAEDPSFRRTRKAFYRVLKPIWRTWLAVHSPRQSTAVRIRR